MMDGDGFGARDESSASSLPFDDWSEYQLHISVVGHRVQPSHLSGNAPFAVYTICSSEGAGRHTWQVERRWSNVRALYYELWNKWKPQLERSSSLDVAPPRFVHHAYRLGSRKLDPILMAARCRELERLLLYFVAALQVSLVRGEGPEVLRRFLTEDSLDCRRHRQLLPARRRMRLSERLGLSTPKADAAREAKAIDPPYRGRTELLPHELKAATDSPTPAERYWTPSGGWPSCVAADSRRGRDANCILLQPVPDALHVPEFDALDEAAARIFPGLDKGGHYTSTAVPAASGATTAAAATAAAAAATTDTAMDKATAAATAASASSSLSAMKDDAVGELRVEVLEAAGLPNLDTFSLTDAYVVVLFEQCAARTCTIHDDLDPKWHAEAPRGFRLPIRRPYSTLFVCVLDDDGDSAMGALDDDDPIGRVVIQPCNLRPHTAIDCWWPLQHKPVGERPGDRGSLRLRLRVEWRDERVLLLHPLLSLRDSRARLADPSEAPAFILRLYTRRALAAVKYAYHGPAPEARYSWPVLRSHLAEFARLALALKAPTRPLREVLLWKRPATSLALCTLWQLLTIYPQYLPACAPLSLILLLEATHRSARRQPLLHRPLPFWPLCATLVLRVLYGALGLSTDGLRIVPAVRQSEGSVDGAGRPTRYASTRPWLLHRGVELAGGVWKLSGASLLVDGAKHAAHKARAGLELRPAMTPMAGTAAVAPAAAAVTSGRAAAASSLHTPPRWLFRRQTTSESAATATETEEEVSRLDDDEAIETVQAIYRSACAVAVAFWGAIRRALSIRPPSARRLRTRLSVRAGIDTVKDLANSLDSNLINPAAWVLGPVQAMLGELLQQVHAAQRLVLWHDSAATTLLYLALSALSLLLALIPWATVIPFVLTWGARLVGLLLLGPHMYWVGLRLEVIAEHQAREEAEEAARRAAAGRSPPTTTPRSKTTTATTMKRVDDDVEDAQPAPGKSAQQGEQQDADATYVFEMESSRKMPRQICRPDVKSAFAFSAT